MARGWESKSVELQQQDAQRSAPPRRKTEADLRRDAKRRTIELARTKAATDLSAARNPAHQEMLRQTLAALDRQLSQVDRDD